MKLVIIVLNKIECLRDVLRRFCDEDLHATILNSTGLAHSLEDDEPNFLASFRMLLDPARKESKTILVMTEKEKIPLIRTILDEETGGWSKPDTGIMCVVNIEEVDK